MDFGITGVDLALRKRTSYLYGKRELLIQHGVLENCNNNFALWHGILDI